MLAVSKPSRPSRRTGFATRSFSTTLSLATRGRLIFCNFSLSVLAARVKMLHAESTPASPAACASLPHDSPYRTNCLQHFNESKRRDLEARCSRCAGEFTLRQPALPLSTFASIARFYDMPLLAETVEWLGAV